MGVVQGAGDGRVFAGGGAVVAGDWCVVRLAYGDSHRGDVAGRAVAIDGVIGEAVGAEKVGVRCVGVRSVGIQHDRAAGWTGIEHGGERVFVAGDAIGVVWIGIVGERKSVV